MKENISTWMSKLALDIYAVIQKYNAAPRFSEMVAVWAKDHESESRKLTSWNKKRKLYFEQNVINDPTLQDENKQPEQDWKFEAHYQHLEKKTESGSCLQRNIIHGWVPPELSKSNKPEIIHPLPLRSDYQLTIADKFAILTAVYEIGKRGTEKLSPLEEPDDWDEPNALSGLVQSISFDCLCDSVSKLDQNNDGWLRTILNEIEKDLKKEMVAKNKQEGKDTSREILPKPPRHLQELLWVKKYGLKHWKLIVLWIVISVGISVGVYACNKFELDDKIINTIKNKPPSSTGHSNTPLYVRTKKRVDGYYDSIKNEKLDPWIFINAGVDVQITKHNGKEINIKGVMFTGSSRIVFWGDDFIPPFIEDTFVKVFDQTIEECKKNGLAPEIYVSEAHKILGDFIYKIYNRMADIDDKLMKKSHPENPGQKDVSREIEKMRKCLKEHYKASLELISVGKE